MVFVYDVGAGGVLKLLADDVNARLKVLELLYLCAHRLAEFQSLLVLRIQLLAYLLYLPVALCVDVMLGIRALLESIETLKYLVVSLLFFVLEVEIFLGFVVEMLPKVSHELDANRDEQNQNYDTFQGVLREEEVDGIHASAPSFSVCLLYWSKPNIYEKDEKPFHIKCP